MPIIELPDGGIIFDEWDEIQPPYSHKAPDDAVNDDKPRQYETVEKEKNRVCYSGTMYNGAVV